MRHKLHEMTAFLMEASLVMDEVVKYKVSTLPMVVREKIM